MIVTLCGSARFEDEFHYWNEFLTLNGFVVFSLAVFPSRKGVKEWYTSIQKSQLDAVHKRKIDASRAIFVITGPVGDRAENAYIGTSTRSEIEYAQDTGKIVVFDFESPASSYALIEALRG